MNTSNVEIDKSIAEKFNAIDSAKSISIALTKDDIALLINSLSELHRSYAAMQKIPFVTIGSKSEDVEINEKSAKKSYELFAQFANGLMSRFINEASK